MFQGVIHRRTNMLVLVVIDMNFGRFEDRNIDRFSERALILIWTANANKALLVPDLALTIGVNVIVLLL